MPVRQYTPAQYLAAVIDADGSRVKAAEALKVTVKAVQSNLAICRRRGMEVPKSSYNTDRAGYMMKQAEAAHAAAPEHYHVKGVSTLYGAEGEVKQQWVKTDQDAEQRLRAIIQGVKDAFLNAEPVPRIAPPKTVDSDLLTLYPIGDAHFGMHAWGDETGDDFDLKIAETDLVNAVRRLVRSSPRSKYGCIVNVGDYIHINDKSNRTPQSGHLLDTDSRYSKIIRVGLRALRTAIEVGLTRHEVVYVFSRPGNHDPDSSVALQVALAMFYEKNPRVVICQSPAPFVYHEFGKNLLGFTHGDTCKLEKLGGVMAADMAEAWGRTTFRHWYTGHIHQDRVYEGQGWVAESFRTLAAKDGYATRMGYRSGRDMHAIVLHKEWGEIERHRVDIAQLKQMRAKE